MNFIKDLSDDIKDLNIALIGGKAYSLAYSYSKSFPIPKAFIISAEAFDYFLRTKLNDRNCILSQLKEHGDYSEDRLAEIRQNIVSAEIPLELSNAICDSFLSLNSEFVAVRSSATAEDGDRRSFAGQFESFLGVTKENLLSSIKSCWSSFFNLRAFAYSNPGKNLGGMAVIVQEMIDAEASGVCFSVNPVTQDKTTIVIEAIFGLGELLVQGLVVPDHYVVSKKTLMIEKNDVKANVQEKKMSLCADGTGSAIDLIEDGSIQRQQKISDDVINEIARMALLLEGEYKRPVDIEWALKAGGLYILQVRPITTV